MSKTIYKVEISAEGYETTIFRDYSTALDYYNKLRSLGLDPTLEERELVADYDSATRHDFIDY